MQSIAHSKSPPCPLTPHRRRPLAMAADPPPPPPPASALMEELAEEVLLRFPPADHHRHHRCSLSVPSMFRIQSLCMFLSEMNGGRYSMIKTLPKHARCGRLCGRPRCRLREDDRLRELPHSRYCITTCHLTYISCLIITASFVQL